jgi:hypothetical protein
MLILSLSLPLSFPLSWPFSSPVIGRHRSVCLVIGFNVSEMINEWGAYAGVLPQAVQSLVQDGATIIIVCGIAQCNKDDSKVDNYRLEQLVQAKCLLFYVYAQGDHK